MIKGCIIFGQIIVIIITAGLAAAAFQDMTGIVIIPGMTPIMDALEIIAMIGIVLLGTFPILFILTKVLNKPLTFIGGKIGLDSVSTAGLIFTLANSIPVYKMMKNMSSKGKIANTAWLVPATAALGDHLGFTAGVHSESITAVVISKIVAGVLAVILANLLSRDTSELDRQSAEIAAAEEQKALAENA
jgi:ethanolamine transporter